MGTNLHQLLRSFCFGTHWKYAIFWKLKHRARMILTWEDAYYDSPDSYDSSENKCCQKTLEKIRSGSFLQDALGLAVAKMSYHVYLLGEGIVGQVAVTGKHRWICVDNQVPGSGPSFEFADGWQSQFSAGIRTIVVVAIVPLGVVQLGSLNKVTEDVGFVTHIRSLFLSTQDYTIGYVPNQLQSSVKNSSSMLDVSTKTLSSESMPTYLHDTMKTMKCEMLDISMPFQCSEKNYAAKNEGPELNANGSSILLQSMSNMTNADDQKFVGMRPVNERKFERNNSDCKEKVGVDYPCFPSDFLDAVVCESDKLHYVDTSYTLKFPAGCELHEALGPSFLERSKYFDCGTLANQDIKTVELTSNEMSCSQLTSESCPEHLLEAMVANVCHSNNNVNRELSFSTSLQAAMASGRNPEGSIHTVYNTNSEGYSIDQAPHIREAKHHSLSSSRICGVVSEKGFSSTCRSSCSEQFERSSEPTKICKKRARPGESCRPRPRDRQLIQDRIKELRELVPNGTKCSIDSLLECTIKHLLFLRSITKHADKLNKFSDTKLHDMEKDIHESSSHQQGSSWAMEVGGHLKVCSILVKNLSKNGQMLVEMLCEECSHFLEIAEAIKSLGLTILNGATLAHGEKTCICFVVEAGSEGQNNRNLHRLDILWPLVQLLQSKSTMYS